MLLPQPMAHGRLVQRYKRFFADVMLDDGEALTAHCPNPGSMLGLNTPGLGVWLSRSDAPKRKLAWTLELVEDGGGLAGVNTMNPNRLVAEALAADAIPELTGYDVHRREVKFGAASRVDFMLTGADRPPAYVEVKNVHLRRGGTLAEFPDCVAARSAKHLRELAAEVAKGARAVQLFVVQRTDCDSFSACAELDPTYAAGLEVAADAGVEVLVYACDITPEAVTLARPIPWARRRGATEDTNWATAKAGESARAAGAVRGHTKSTKEAKLTKGHLCSG